MRATMPHVIEDLFSLLKEQPWMLWGMYFLIMLAMLLVSIIVIVVICYTIKAIDRLVSKLSETISEAIATVTDLLREQGVDPLDKIIKIWRHFGTSQTQTEKTAVNKNNKQRTKRRDRNKNAHN